MHDRYSHSGLASLVASRGRGDDTMLVHMTPGEVKGLQSLALAHGGSLTVNPDTGLVEAGFLKSLLPTLIGAILTPLTGGLINPMTAGLIVGGVEGARTGDLGKGLMAGLGAYGGAGLSSALAGAGSVAKDAALQGTLDAAKTTAATTAEKAAADTAINKTMQEQIAKQATNKAAMNFGNVMGGTKAIFSANSPLGTNAMSSIGNVASNIGGTGFGGMAAKAGLANAAAGALTPEMQFPQGEDPKDQLYWQSKGYDPSRGFLGGSFQKGYPGMTSYAGGGTIPVPNAHYPMANIQHSAYAAPTQNPTQTELFSGYDTAINPFTGEEAKPQVNFDDGGEVDGMMTRPRDPPRPDAAPPTQGGLREYYQSLLQAPTNQAPSMAPLANYMSGLNQLVSSPINPPPGQAITPPSTGTGTGGTGGTGSTGTGTDTGTNTTNPYGPGYRGPRYTFNPVTGEPMDMTDIIGGGENTTVPTWRRQPTQPTAQNQPTQPNQPTTQPPVVEPPPYDPSLDPGMNDNWGTMWGDSPLADPNYARSMYDGAWTGTDPNDPSRFVNSTLGSTPAQPTSPSDYWDTLSQQGGYQDNAFQGDASMMFARGGGIRSLQYAAAGKLLRGPGDGMSDDIKANIGGRQEARLADGEFVVPADVVSHLGNGSTEAGSRQLYKMMDNIRQARTGRKKQAPAVKASKYLPK